MLWKRRLLPTSRPITPDIRNAIRIPPPSASGRVHRVRAVDSGSPRESAIQRIGINHGGIRLWRERRDNFFGLDMASGEGTRWLGREDFELAKYYRKIS